MDFCPAYQEVQPSELSALGSVCFVLHGILGSSRNWSSFSRRLAVAHPTWRFILVDHRNHGDSRGAVPPHSVRACAHDLSVLAQKTGPPQVIIGHSFGGKVALAYAREYGAGLRHVWSLDATPGARDRLDSTSNEVERVIVAARKLPTPAPDRRAVAAHFLSLGFSKMLAGWMTTNVRRGPDGLVWRFDLDGVEAMLSSYWRDDLWPFIESAPAGLSVHLLRAERSDRWTPTMVARLEAAGVDAPVLKDAGHWVHVDNPDALFALLTSSFPPDN